MKYLCFDIESCDGGKNGSLCSFGYCLADENLEIIEQEDIIVNPNKPFNKRLFGTVIKLAYTEQVFRSAPRFPLVYNRIRGLFDDVTVIGFSIINDVNYLADSVRTYKLQPFDYDFYDVQLMYGIYKKESRNFSLASAAAEFDIEFLEHRSMDDAVATLKVLKGVLAATGLTFEQFIERYGVMPGTIRKFTIRNCYTDMVYTGIDYNNAKTKKRLLNEFVLSCKREKTNGLAFSHKVVCFDEDIELDDITLTRNRIDKLYKLGGRYSSGVECSNVFVYDKTDSPRYNYAVNAKNSGHRLLFMHLSAFLKVLGDVPNNIYDDAAILYAGNKRRRKNREHAAKLNFFKQRAAQGQGAQQPPQTPPAPKSKKRHGKRGKKLDDTR